MVFALRWSIILKFETGEGNIRDEGNESFEFESDISIDDRV